jgi:hypothetical protein
MESRVHKRTTRILQLLLTLAVCTTVLTITAAAPITPNPQPVPKYKQERETVTKDQPIHLPGRPNTILRIEKMKESPIEIKWTIFQNGVEKAQLPDWSGGTMKTEAKVEDLDGDGKPEVLIYRYGSGSGGAMALNVYQPQAGNWRELLSALPDWQQQNTRFQVRYIGNYKASFRDQETGMTAIIPLDPVRYEGMRPYLQKSGQTMDEYLSKHIRDWVDPWSFYKTVDLDHDGKKEIVAYQDVVGDTHPDRIARLTTTFKLKNGVYQPALYTLYSLIDGEHDKMLAQVHAKFL